MSLEDLGNIGEFVAAVAVIVSLIYLAVQIRQNTQAIQTESASASQDALANANYQMAANPRLYEVFLQASNSGGMKALDPVDALMLSSYLRAIGQQFESIYFRSRSGALSADIWEVRRSWFAGWIAIPVVAEWWAGERTSSTFTQPFIHEVELAEPGDVGATGRSNM